MPPTLHISFTIIPIASIAFFALDNQPLQSDWQLASIQITVHQPTYWQLLSQILRALPTPEGHYLAPLQDGAILPFALLQLTLSQLPLIKVVADNAPPTTPPPVLPKGAVS